MPIRNTLKAQLACLNGLKEELEAGIAEVENLEFHHAELQTVEGAHYARLILMQEAVNAQIKRLPIVISAASKSRD